MNAQGGLALDVTEYQYLIASFLLEKSEMTQLQALTNFWSCPSPLPRCSASLLSLFTAWGDDRVDGPPTPERPRCCREAAGTGRNSDKTEWEDRKTRISLADSSVGPELRPVVYPRPLAERPS